MANELYKGDAVRNIALGLRVEKTAAIDATADDLFTVTGECLITLFYGIVTGAGDGTVETILVREKADTLNLCAATTVTSDAVGEVYWVTGDHAIILNGTGNIPRLKIASLLSAFQHNAFIFDGQSGLTIELIATDGGDAVLAVKWVILYIPLEDGANIVAA